MNRLLELLAEQTGEYSGRSARQHLANQLDVSRQAVHQWFKRGYMPLTRAVECEYLFGIDKSLLIDPKLADRLDLDLFND